MSWASAARRKALVLEVIACSAAACDRAAWRCAAASRLVRPQPGPRRARAGRALPRRSVMSACSGG
jgi:hypothetical protein